MTDEERIAKLEQQVAELIANSNKLIARTAALGTVLQCVLWGWDQRPAGELAKGLLEAGAAARPVVNQMTPEMQAEVVQVWNVSFATLTSPGDLAFALGDVSPATAKFQVN